MIFVIYHQNHIDMNYLEKEIDRHNFLLFDFQNHNYQASHYKQSLT